MEILHNFMIHKNKIMERFNQLKQLILESEADFIKFFDQNNQAAGTRVRNKMQALKVLAQDIRTEVTAKKQSK